MKKKLRHKLSHIISIVAMGCFLAFFASLAWGFYELLLCAAFGLAVISVFLYRRNITGWLVLFFLLLLYLFVAWLFYGHSGIGF